MRRFAGAGTDFWSDKVYLCATNQITLSLRSAAPHHSASKASLICHRIFLVWSWLTVLGVDPALSVNKQ